MGRKKGRRERGWGGTKGERRAGRAALEEWGSGDDARTSARTLFHFWLCPRHDPRPGLVRAKEELMPSSLLIHHP